MKLAIILAIAFLGLILISGCTTSSYCGDFVCNQNESFETCPNDCVESSTIDVAGFLNEATYRGGVDVGSTISCDEYCGSFGETCILGQFTEADESAYNSELVRCEFKELGRETNCVCTNPDNSDEELISNLLNEAAHRGHAGSTFSCDDYLNNQIKADFKP